MSKTQLTPERFHEFFEYRDDGNLVWKVSRRGGKAYPGALVGNRRSDGYVTVGVANQKLLLHRIIFAMHRGYMPEVIDHIDGDPWNNRIENLREADNSKNQYNRKMDSRCKTGMKNVFWHIRDKTWVVRMKVGDRVRRFGTYKDPELAELVATLAREKYRGEFARHA